MASDRVSAKEAHRMKLETQSAKVLNPREKHGGAIIDGPSSAQVDAALKLYLGMEQWLVGDASLRRLKASMPGFDEETCVIKAASVNSLYGTRLLAIVRMARHVARVLAEVELATAPRIELVERIAALPPNLGEGQRRFVSFAAKFCHFFVDDEIPIYDQAACWTLDLHLGSGPQPRRTYAEFCADFERLRESAGFTMTPWRLDRYLWLVGMYGRWIENRPVSSELRRVLSAPSEEAARLLDNMLPRQLPRWRQGKPQ
jgi:hypothetical protein